MFLIFSTAIDAFDPNAANYDDMGPKKKGRGKNRKPAPTPPPDSRDIYTDVGYLFI